MDRGKKEICEMEEDGLRVTNSELEGHKLIKDKQ